jgi:ArsR family transcriptional regulator
VFTKRDRPVELAPGQFDRIAKALADPRRFALFEAIAAGGEECPNQRLCQDFPVSKATVSHHLKELTQAGLVESEKEGQFVTYRARRDVLKAYTTELMRRSGETPTV